MSSDPEEQLWRTRPFQVDPWLDLPPALGEPYPLEGFELVDDEILRLASMINPLRNPGGTTVLVTGERGAGKTSLVNAALFHASLRARFNDGWLVPQGEEDRDTRGRLLSEDTWKAWANTEWYATNTPPEAKRLQFFGWQQDEQTRDGHALRKKALKYQAEQQEQRAKRLKGFEAMVLLDVHVPFPESYLTQRQILSRTLRRLYFRLVTAGLADANPHFVRNARLAYLRSIAKTSKFTEREKYVASFESGLQKGEIGFAAKQELELSWELAIELDRSDESELGDDLQLLLEDLARLRLGGDGLLKRSIRSLTGMFNNAKDFFQGEEKLRIHPVIIFDEIDKALPIDAAKAQEQSPVPGHGPGGQLDKASYLAKVVGALKTVLTSHGATFVFIAGSEHAQRWSNSGHDVRDSELLRSVFSDRFHVRRLSIEKVNTLVKQYCNDAIRYGDKHPHREVASTIEDIPIDAYAKALHYVSGGLMRSVVRLLREAQLKNRERDSRRRFHRVHLAEVLTGLDATEKSRAPEFVTSLQRLAECHKVVNSARKALVARVRQLELPSAATRVAGKIFALEDAMWGAAQRTLEALRQTDRIYQAAPKKEYPAKRLLDTLASDLALLEWSQWFYGLRTDDPANPADFLRSGALPLMVNAVLDAIDEHQAHLLETDPGVIRTGVEQSHKRTADKSELAP